MKLQILVPQYKETDEVIKPLLDSLMIQQNVDFNEFGVIIVNDGTDVHLTQNFLHSYPFRIDYYFSPHRGVSATRNTCLDYATADYVMFCDADDMFFNACGLYLIFREINRGFDTLTTKFVEEARFQDTGEPIYINHENDRTFVHGKIHRRQYLVDNNIRWNPNLTIHEDSFFTVLTQTLAKDAKYLEDAFYLWKYRKESICRKDDKYILKTFYRLIDSIDALIDEFEKRDKHAEAVNYAAYIIFYVYYHLNEKKWKEEENAEYRAITERRICEFLKKRYKLWIEASDEEKKNLAKDCRAMALDEGMEQEELTLNQWLAYIIDTYMPVDKN